MEDPRFTIEDSEDCSSVSPDDMDGRDTKDLLCKWIVVFDYVECEKKAVSIYSFPSPPPGAGDWDDFSLLPFFAFPEGIWTRSSDYNFFTVDSTSEDNDKFLYGVSCFQQERRTVRGCGGDEKEDNASDSEIIARCVVFLCVAPLVGLILTRVHPVFSEWFSSTIALNTEDFDSSSFLPFRELFIELNATLPTYIVPFLRKLSSLPPPPPVSIPYSSVSAGRKTRRKPPVVEERLIRTQRQLEQNPPPVYYSENVEADLKALARREKGKQKVSVEETEDRSDDSDEKDDNEDPDRSVGAEAAVPSEPGFVEFDETPFFVGYPLCGLLRLFGPSFLQIFKLMLLEMRILVFAHPPCLAPKTVLTLASLVPGSMACLVPQEYVPTPMERDDTSPFIPRSQDSLRPSNAALEGGLALGQLGLPLKIFSSASPDSLDGPGRSFLHPFVPAVKIELLQALAAAGKGFLAGCSSSVFLTATVGADAVVNITTGEVEIRSQRAHASALSKADRAFMSRIVTAVSKQVSRRSAGMRVVGSETWARGMLSKYVQSFLLHCASCPNVILPPPQYSWQPGAQWRDLARIGPVLLDSDLEVVAPFGTPFVHAWLQTDNCSTWRRDISENWPRSTSLPWRHPGEGSHIVLSTFSSLYDDVSDAASSALKTFRDSLFGAVDVLKTSSKPGPEPEGKSEENDEEEVTMPVAAEEEVFEWVFAGDEERFVKMDEMGSIGNPDDEQIVGSKTWGGRLFRSISRSVSRRRGTNDYIPPPIGGIVVDPVETNPEDWNSDSESNGEMDEEGDDGQEVTLTREEKDGEGECDGSDSPSLEITPAPEELEDLDDDWEIL